jgi:hypothetical protein
VIQQQPSATSIDDTSNIASSSQAGNAFDEKQGAKKTQFSS